MNEFTAKKLGEVLAFAKVGRETIDKGLRGFTQSFGEERVKEILESINSHTDLIHTIADSNSRLDVVEKKLESTGNKLREMRDMYVGDEWDNPTELLEWSGFFEGAALVHWSLVQGAAEETGNETLKSLATQGISFHKNLLNEIEGLLHSVGAEKSKN